MLYLGRRLRAPAHCCAAAGRATATRPAAPHQQLGMASMKKMLANLRIRSRLILGFGIVCLILAASIGITILKVGEGNSVTQLTINVRVPTALAGDMVVGQVYGSLAALRGWMLTGNPNLSPAS